jgi:hypothetical protein
VTIPVEIWIRGTDVATTIELRNIAREPAAWVDDDVREILEGMLNAMYDVKNDAKSPGGGSRVAQLRGFSWIVNPFEGGVLIALEMTLGAAVAGPFKIDKARLEAMITRVMTSSTSAPPTVVH